MTRQTSDGKEPFSTLVYESHAAQIRALEESNTDIVNAAIELYLQSRGIAAGDLEAEKREVENEIELYEEKRERVDEHLEELYAKREEIETAIAVQDSQRATYEELVATIAEGLAEHPFEKIDAYTSELTDAISASPPEVDPTRQDVIDDVLAYADEHGLEISDDQLPSLGPTGPTGPSTPDAVSGRADRPMVAADGAGSGDPGATLRGSSRATDDEDAEDEEADR